MKTIKILAASMLMALAFMSASAQENKSHQGNPDNWKQKMQAEKVAFLTNELDLSPAEAQKFWPVYNEQSKKMDAALKDVHESMKALKMAIKEGKSDKEISSLLDAYLKAKANSAALPLQAQKEFNKALSAAKVAKLFVAEENFRCNQFSRLQGGNAHGQGQHPQGGQRPQSGQRPEGARPEHK